MFNIHHTHLKGVEGFGEDGAVVVVVADGDGDGGGGGVDAVVGRDDQRVVVLPLSVQWSDGHDGACTTTNLEIT